MKAVIQRVTKADLSVNGQLISEINNGLVVYFGVKAGDKKEYCDYLSKKIVNMRIFEDDNKKMNLSLLHNGYEILLVSQFTLCASCEHGNRPDFILAEKPTVANEIYEYMITSLQKNGATVKTGIFGADMKINQLNDGPVTIILDTDTDSHFSGE